MAETLPTSAAVAPILAGDEMTISSQSPPPSGSQTALSDSDKVTLMSYCPNAWPGDAGFVNWSYMVYNMGAASGQPAPAPVVSGLSPASVQHNKNNDIIISGTGFDPATAIVVLNGTTNITPKPSPPPAPTSLTVTILSSQTPTAGSVTLAVINGDGQVSSAATLTVT